MKELGISSVDIINGKNSEFENLANYCKVVYENFSKMITAHRSTMI